MTWEKVDNRGTSNSIGSDYVQGSGVTQRVCNLGQLRCQRKRDYDGVDFGYCQMTMTYQQVSSLCST